MNNYIMFEVSESLSEQEVEDLFKELHTLSTVDQVGRINKKKDNGFYHYCFLTVSDKDKLNEVMSILRQDTRVTSAYVPAPRYLV